ncbi:MAG TPA: homogentisate 1,2-dioxygenase [Actinomycetota bacterium]|nr:homogentisate 1,2-dioxygenase [Actinomycetota bacterium]
MIPQSKGQVSRQAHVGIPAGTYEDEHGREAFAGRASHLYRTHPPTAWVRIEGPLRPHALDLNEIEGGDEAGWVRILGNARCRIYTYKPTEAPSYYLRDADGDVCYFVHKGSGTLETDYGPLEFEAGDYLIVPKGTTHRPVPKTKDNFLLVIEGSGEYSIPDRGLMGKHAQFDPGVLVTPEPDPRDDKGEFEVRVKRDEDYTSLFFQWHPLDVVGWQGDLCPVKLNVRDYRPVMSPRYHMPPSAHATWANDGFAICTFAPRPLEEDPEVLRVPFYHANIDNDEVLFYHSGEFFSRPGIGVGKLTLHPQGIHHGPQPAAIEASKAKDRTEEVAVMVETEDPLEVSDEAMKVRDDAYELSWARGMGLID